MAVNIVRSAGSSVTVDREGYYVLRTWYHLEGGGRMQDALIDRLTWAELIDALLESLEDHRPGWGVGLGFRQPPLDFSDRGDVAGE